MSRKGWDQEERLAEQVGRGVAEMLSREEKRIWSEVREQSRDSALGRSGLGGGVTDAKKEIWAGLTKRA